MLDFNGSYLTCTHKEQAIKLFY